jgi:hypothetical protein
MHKVLRGVLWWGSVGIIFLVVDHILGQPKNWLLEISPASLARLDTESVLALMVTFATTLIAWFVGRLIGDGVGYLNAATIIDGPVSDSWFKWGIGYNIDRFFDAVYVIPFVLTISLAQATLVSASSVPPYLRGFILVSLAGTTLGGYLVYKAIFESVSRATREAVVLTESLDFVALQDRVGRRHNILDRLERVLKRRDCAIQSFCQAVPRSFHLAVVSVMILETVIPVFYEAFFPQPDVIKGWLGGAGWQILKAQQNYQFAKIAGYIWAVLIFDALFVSAVERWLHHRWQRYYLED